MHDHKRVARRERALLAEERHERAARRAVRHALERHAQRLDELDVLELREVDLDGDVLEDLRIRGERRRGRVTIAAGTLRLSSGGWLSSSGPGNVHE